MLVKAICCVPLNLGILEISSPDFFWSRRNLNPGAGTSHFAASSLSSSNRLIKSSNDSAIVPVASRRFFVGGRKEMDVNPFTIFSTSFPSFWELTELMDIITPILFKYLSFLTSKLSLCLRVLGAKLCLSWALTVGGFP